MNAIGTVGSSSGMINNSYENIQRLGRIIVPWTSSRGQGSQAAASSAWGQGGSIPNSAGHVDLCA